jgi:hypothetical protein
MNNSIPSDQETFSQKSGSFSMKRRQSRDFFKKSGETSEGFFKIRLNKKTSDNFLLKKQNLSRLQTLPM